MRRFSPLYVTVTVWLVAMTSTGCGGKTARPRPAAVAAPLNTQKLASKAFDALKANTPLEDDRRTSAFIICVAEEVIRDIHGDWEIAIFRQRSPSLFVLPGRKIGVNSGIMTVVRNQHQLAALMAHSLAHTQANHAEKRLMASLGASPTTDVQRAVERPFSPEGQATLSALGVITDRIAPVPFDASDEAEANVLGLELMARAGFNPRESMLVWRSVEGGSASRAGGMAAAHPGGADRAAQSDANIDRALRLQQEALTSRKKPDCDRIRR